MKNIILFSLITFLMVTSWITFSVYHTHVSTTIAPDVTLKINPISPQFDTETLDKLRTRKSLPVSLSSNLQLLNAPVSGSPSSQRAPLVEKEPIASDSAGQL